MQTAKFHLVFPICSWENSAKRPILDRSRWTRIYRDTRISPYSVAVAGRGVSFQITILKVLAGHPEGRASLADLKHYVAVLISSGADWSQRMKRLAARAPDLDIFSSGYVLREPTAWQITEKGREFLALIETPFAEPALTPVALPLPVVSDPADLPPNVVPLAGHKVHRRRPRSVGQTPPGVVT